MKSAIFLILPILTSGFCSLASASVHKDRHAAQADGSTTAPASEGDRGTGVDVAVPHPDLTDSQGMEIRSVTEMPVLLAPRFGEGPRLEFSASSWVPGSLTTASHLSDASAFTDSGVPEVNLMFLSSPIAHYGSSFTVSLRAGIGYEVLHRTGTFAGDDVAPAQAVREVGYLVPLTLGAEARMAIRGPWSLYGDLSLVPMAAFTTRTVFVTEEGGATFGAPLEAALGVANDLRWISSTLRGIEIKAGVVGTANTFGSSDFSGLGALAGVSLAL